MRKLVWKLFEDKKINEEVANLLLDALEKRALKKRLK